MKTTTTTKRPDVYGVDRYGADNSGARACFFRPAPDVEVVVKSWNSDRNEACFQLACDLAGAARRQVDDASTIESLRAEVNALRAKVAPPTPALLLGPGCVRFDGNGVLWLLNIKRDPKTDVALPSRGFGEFGFAMPAGWDELFRRYNVKVTSQGVDEHGPFWIVENIRA